MPVLLNIKWDTLPDRFVLLWPAREIVFRWVEQITVTGDAGVQFQAYKRWPSALLTTRPYFGPLSRYVLSNNGYVYPKKVYRKNSKIFSAMSEALAVITSASLMTKAVAFHCQATPMLCSPSLPHQSHLSSTISPYCEYDFRVNS